MVKEMLISFAAAILLLSLLVLYIYSDELLWGLIDIIVKRLDKKGPVGR